MARMDLSPQSVAAATFKTVKKGFDPDEVRSYLAKVASNLETSQQQAAAMEARARAAIAKMQELAQQASHTPAPVAPAPAAEPAVRNTEITAGPDDSETISRTLLLAQRTADLAVADAKVEAESITAAAHTEATSVLDAARAEAARLLDEARGEARHAKDAELSSAEEAVQSLLARRDFLLGDVEHLEQHVGAQRERLRDAVGALQDIIERVPGGLGEMRRPLLSASAQEPDASVSSGTGADTGSVDGDPSGGGAVTSEVSWTDDRDLDSPDPATAIARPEPLVPLTSDQRSDLSQAWRAAEQADNEAAAAPDQPDVAVDPAADDTHPVDATPREGQLRLGGDPAPPPPFRIGGTEI